MYSSSGRFRCCLRFVASWFVGFLPVTRVLLVLPSCCQGKLLLALLVVLLRWEPITAGRLGAGSRQIKLVWSSDPFLEACCCDVPMEVTGWFLFFSHHGGGGGESWVAVLHRPSWRGAAYFCGVHQLRSYLAVVILGHGSRSVLRCCARSRFLNLQAGVPSRRPFCFSVTALNASPTSSGFVPDAGAGGRDVGCILLRWRT